MKRIRLGVIGCGVMGPKHLQSAVELPDLVEPVAVADLIDERARDAAAKFNVPRIYHAGNDLIDDPDIDAIVLAFPARDRARLALRAFARGKHVLTEKPVAMKVSVGASRLNDASCITAFM